MGEKIENRIDAFIIHVPLSGTKSVYKKKGNPIALGRQLASCKVKRAAIVERFMTYSKISPSKESSLNVSP